ncbi:MAG: CBS domain-containing protein [Phycisphaerae bacterium]|nr:CBS domain-containing protein [Phycisphaerae bacterium]
MITAGHLVTIKGGEVATLPPTATALEAAELMNDRHIGSVLVIEDGRIAGIFTERDLMRRIVAAQRSAEHTQLSEVMTIPVACATQHTMLDELRVVMREQRIRHVPVVDGGRLLGIISIGDLNRAEREVQEETIHYLEQYITLR